jgi:hypothetical protein
MRTAASGLPAPIRAEHRHVHVIVAAARKTDTIVKLSMKTNLWKLTGAWPLLTHRPTNVLFYTAPDAGNSPARYYRAFQFP